MSNCPILYRTPILFRNALPCGILANVNRNAIHVLVRRLSNALQAKQTCPSSRRPTVAFNLCRLDRHLQYAIALVGEQVIGFDDVFELVLMRDEHAEIQTVRFQHSHQASHAFLATGA